MLGGPKDGSVIPSFAAHAACSIWDGCDRGVLTCHTRHSTCARLREWREEFVELTSDASGTFRQRTRDEVRTDKIISASGLSALPRIMYQHIDAPLLSAFVERWQPDTNSFHMPFGEMTIMLHDVAYILGLPIEGKVVTGHSKIEDAMDDVYELLGVPELTLANDDDYVSGGVTEESFFNLCCAEGRVPETRATGYMFLTLGSTIFVDKGDSRLRPGLISELMDEASVGTYSWGSATLAYLYRQLGIASRQRCKALAGCLTLLQAWIYEYFPCFRPHQKRLTLRDGDPRCCMWDVRPEPKSRNRLVAFRNRIDNMTVDEVMWLPYGPNSIERCRRTMFTGFIMHHSIVEPYMAYRCVRQIGFMQFIPPRIPRPVKAYRPEEPKNYYVEWPYNLAQDSWDTFPVSFCLNPCSLAYCQNTGACTDDYLNWFTTYSHPFVVNDIDVVPSHGLDATVGEYWMARLSEKATILFDPLVEQLPQQFDTLRLGLHDLRNELKQFETVGVRRPMPQSMPPGWGGQG